MKVIAVGVESVVVKVKSMGQMGCNSVCIMKPAPPIFYAGRRRGMSNYAN
jgi:hypothetical protein